MRAGAHLATARTESSDDRNPQENCCENLSRPWAGFLEKINRNSHRPGFVPGTPRMKREHFEAFDIAVDPEVVVVAAQAHRERAVLDRFPLSRPTPRRRLLLRGKRAGLRARAIPGEVSPDPHRSTLEKRGET